MNPYLEQPALWHQVHNRLIIAIADVLTPQIAPKYRVSIEERVYTSVDDKLLAGIADVAVANATPVLSSSQTQQSTAATTTKPIVIQLPMPEEVIERFLEVKLTQSGEIVTVIEILSPKNKRSGPGRDAYQTKRRKIFQSQTSLVEIDLLRGGEPMPMLIDIDKPYRIMVSRGHCRPAADLYAVSLPEPLPEIPIPLRPDELEPLVNLQTVLNEVYERARFDLAIAYTQPLTPAISAQEKAWIKTIVSSFDP
ncbi:MAG: DUF4058 family protein [Merismopedia sp. SIO2A8]|nr:DUF4058 family protein [Symploca sp. SIO2B6]NET48865.1 DUF4058 family protein [Merismopedia sp. SIO2A8]